MVQFSTPPSRPAIGHDGDERDPSTSHPSASRRGALASSTRLPVAGAVALFVGIAVLYSVAEPPFSPPDETAHVGYAHEIAAGDLPAIDRQPHVPPHADQWEAERASAPDGRYRAVWVANHPPLHYVAAAPLIWLSNATHRADGGLLFMRWLNVAFAAAGVVLTFLLARELGGDERTSVAAAYLVALVPHGHALFAEGLSDGAAFAATTFVTWAAVRCLARPPSRRDLIVLAAATTVCFGARLSTAAVAVALTAVVAGAQLATRGVAGGVRARRALLVLGAGVGPATLLAGWFYVRNLVRYGDVGGSEFLLERFSRQPRGSVLDVLGWGDLWTDLFRNLLSPSPLSAVAAPPGTTLFGVLAAAGVAVVAITGTTGARRVDGTRRRADRAALVLGLVVVAVVVITVAYHVAGGGSRYARYLLPAIGVLAALVAIGLDRLVPRWLPALAVALLALWALWNLPIGVDPASITRPRDRGRPMPAELRTLPSHPLIQLGAWTLLLTGLALAAHTLARPRHRGP